jgi:hypothetical protein
MLRLASRNYLKDAIDTALQRISAGNHAHHVEPGRPQRGRGAAAVLLAYCTSVNLPFPRSLSSGQPSPCRQRQEVRSECTRRLRRAADGCARHRLRLSERAEHSRVSRRGPLTRGALRVVERFCRQECGGFTASPYSPDVRSALRVASSA